MSLAALCLNGFLATLLLAALVMGMRLDKKLRGVRDGQQAFVLAVSELNAAASKAQAALADLRIATDEATDTLGGRIARGREVADRLEKLVNRAETAPARGQAQPTVSQAAPQGPRDPADLATGLAALLARIDSVAEAPRAAPVATAPVRQQALARPMAPARVRRNEIDDDLFVDLERRA
jgi:hypothetical protein